MKTVKTDVQTNGVGAPLKPVKFPKGSFTIEQAVNLNPNVCELTVRKRVTAAIKGFYITGTGKNKRRIEVPVTHQQGEPIPQPKQSVGRPKYRIEPIGTPAKTAPATVRKTPTAKKTSTVSVVDVTASKSTPTVTQSEVTTATSPVSVVTPAPLP